MVVLDYIGIEVYISLGFPFLTIFRANDNNLCIVLSYIFRVFVKFSWPDISHYLNKYII